MNQPASFTLLEKKIGITFRNKDLLCQALTHRSAVKQSKTNGHNERFEFLGDAVLELAVTEYLFEFEDKDEGELTSWRSALVKGENLASVAGELKLGDYIFMSKGEEASGGREKESTLANALEALIGAIYLDQGFEMTKSFCNDFILVQLRELLARGAHRDHKSIFQERAQEEVGITPHYAVEGEEGPDHDKQFTCAVYLEDERIAEGNGNSKQKAEQDAAKNALAAKKWH